MASQATTCRVFVATVVRDLAKHLQQLLPSVAVEDVPFTGNSDPTAEQSQELKTRMQNAEILLCDRNALLACMTAGATSSLKWIQTTNAGVDQLFKEWNFQKPFQNVVLTRTGEAYGEIMAEYVAGHIIAREKDFAGIRKMQEQKEWSNQQFYYFRPLHTLSIGILGCGSIGQHIARVCKALGMMVWAVNRTRRTTSPHVDHHRTIDDLEEVLGSCDYVCNILPDTPTTCNLLSGNVLKRCQDRKSVLINIGRGTVISDDSLVHAISEGWIGGAILDVFHKEPLPPSSPLWTLPGVTITPHVSGPSLPQEVARSFVSNFKRYQAGQPLQYVVDWDKGY